MDRNPKHEGEALAERNGENHKRKVRKMVGIIKKVNWLGSGIIATAKGEKLPFVGSDILNQQTIKAGERVVFSLRIAKSRMFAQHIVAKPVSH